MTKLKEKNINELVKKSEKETHLNPQITFKDKIRKALIDKDVHVRVKNESISNELIINFELGWYFINSWTNLYYFYKKNTTLYELNKSKFEYLVHTISWINPTESIYKFMSKEFEFHALKKWEKVEIKEFSYFNKKTNTLYVFNNGNKIIKITEDNIEEINNWSEWIIFLKKEHHEIWTYDKNITEIDYIWDLLDSINFNETFLSKEEYKIILEKYIYGLFFPDLLSNRPILVFVWEKWSWKSYALEMFSKIFYGDNTSLWTFQSKEDDIKTTLINEYWCIFDNVDWKVDDWKIDLLCSVSTGTSIKTRKLYKNNEIIITKVNCFVAITTRNPYFKRDDLCDRMIIIHLDRIEGWFESSNLSKEKFLNNRWIIMSRLCINLQWLLKWTKKLEDYSSNFRVSDFANFSYNIDKDNKEKLDVIFDKLVTTQQELTNSTDSLVLLIDYLLEESKNHEYVYWFKEWEFYKWNELHKIFSEFAANNKHLVTYWFKNVKSLTKKLNSNVISYKNINNINIEKTRVSWNLTWYGISKWVTKDEAKKIF